MGSPKTSIFQIKVAGDAIEKLLKDFNFSTVLDIGCGKGIHTDIFQKHNKIVTATDYYKQFPNVVEGLYQDLKFEPHDITWASHVLEHQLNVNDFLKKVRKETKEGGYTCITVPPLKHSVVGGHVCLWNAGLLLYNLVLAGFDCKTACIKKYGYNITVIAKASSFDLPKLNYDSGDITLLKPWLPEFCNEGFNGDIDNWNW
jgi:SAM-dependent methyltransferase